jgi:hypothetical protein
MAIAIDCRATVEHLIAEHPLVEIQVEQGRFLRRCQQTLLRRLAVNQVVPQESIFVGL